MTQMPALGSETLGGQLSAPAQGHVLFASRAELRSMGEEDFFLQNCKQWVFLCFSGSLSKELGHLVREPDIVFQ